MKVTRASVFATSSRIEQGHVETPQKLQKFQTLSHPREDPTGPRHQLVLAIDRLPLLLIPSSSTQGENCAQDGAEGGSGERRERRRRAGAAGGTTAPSDSRAPRRPGGAPAACRDRRRPVADSAPHPAARHPALHLHRAQHRHRRRWIALPRRQSHLPSPLPRLPRLRLPRQCICWHRTLLCGCVCSRGYRGRDGVGTDPQILEGVGLLGRSRPSPSLCGIFDVYIGTGKRGDTGGGFVARNSQLVVVGVRNCLCRSWIVVSWHLETQSSAKGRLEKTSS